MVSRAQYMTLHLRIAHETVICHDPHNLSDKDYCITTQLGYKPTYLSKWLICNFCKSITCLFYSCVSMGYDKLLK
jgi:hypothetical protein